MVYIAFLSLAVAIVASIMYIRLRRRVKRLLSEGVFLGIGPKERETLKEITYRRFAIVHNMYEMLFLTCGNSPKYNGKLADYLAQEYTSGRVGALSEDIVYSLNLCEGGALYKMASEYGLTDLELRTCCYIHAGFKWQQTCTAENLTENAYSVRCSRIRKKLRMEKDEKIPEFIRNYCKQHSNSSVL